MLFPVADQLADTHWDDVRRIYRRMCLLRAAGRDRDAERIENSDLARALARARTQSAGTEIDEAAVLAQEAERVTNAAVLAELLAPLLAEHLQHPVAQTAPLSTVVATPPSATSPATAPVSPPNTPAYSPPAGSAAPRPPVLNAPSVADLLDGMLAQNPPRPSASTARP